MADDQTTDTTPNPSPEVPADTKATDQGKPPSAAWREALGDPEVRGAKTLDKFRGANDRELLEQVAKGYINLEKLPRGVVIPKDDAPQAEWDAYYEKAGRPKTPDEYGIPVQTPTRAAWSEEAQKIVLAKMHARGLTKRQAEGLLGDYLAMADETLTLDERNRNASAQEAYDAMKREWGGLTDRNVAMVQRAVHEFGGEDLKAYLDESGLGNDPRFFKFVHRMAQPLVEDGYIAGENLGMKRDEARAELKKIMASDEYLKYRGSPSAPERRALMQRIEALTELAYNE
jgi:hypothetical protein